MEMKKPYFMTNKDWYYVDEDWQVRIKKDAPEKAKESYREWIKAHDDEALVKD